MVGGGGPAIVRALRGDDTGLLRALADDFRATGMTHIIAISGRILPCSSVAGLICLAIASAILCYDNSNYVW